VTASATEKALVQVICIIVFMRAVAAKTLDGIGQGEECIDASDDFVLLGEWW
jgi:hypothetical protein